MIRAKEVDKKTRIKPDGLMLAGWEYVDVFGDLEIWRRMKDMLLYDRQLAMVDEIFLERKGEPQPPLFYFNLLK